MTAEARALADALLPHIAALSPSELAHCYWSFAQSSQGAGGDLDPAILAFLDAAQHQLLAPVGSELRHEAEGASGGPSDRRRVRCGCRLATMGDKDLSKLAWALATMGFGAGARIPRSGRPADTSDGSSAGAEAEPGSQACPIRAATQKPLRGGSGSVRAAGHQARPSGISQAASPAGGESSDRSATVHRQRQEQQRQQEHQQEQGGQLWRELGNAAADAIDRNAVSPQALCTLLWSFASVRQQHRELLVAAAECISSGRRSLFKPIGVANLWWAFATLGFFENGRSDASSNRHDGMYGNDYDDSNDDRSSDDELLDLPFGDFDDVGSVRGVHDLREKRKQVTGTGQAALPTRGRGHSAARTQRRPPRSGAPSGVEQSRSINNGPSVSASARLYDKLYGMLCRLASSAVCTMGLQELANTAWSVVEARQHRRLPAAQELLEEICIRASQLQKAASAAAAATAAGGWASPLGPSNDEDIWDDGGSGGNGGAAAGRRGDVAAAAAVRRIPHDPHATSVLAWALTAGARPRDAACMSYLDAAVASALAAPSGLTSYRDRDVAMLMTAHKRAAHYSPPLMQAVREELLRRADRMEPQALTEVVYCIAVSNYYNSPMFEAVAAGAARRLHHFGPELASRLVWSMARARHYCPELLDAACQYMRPLLPVCSARGLVSLATALAHLNHYHPPLFRSLSAEAARRLGPSLDGVTRALPGEQTRGPAVLTGKGKHGTAALLAAQDASSPSSSSPKMSLHPAVGARRTPTVPGHPRRPGASRSLSGVPGYAEAAAGAEAEVRGPSSAAVRAPLNPRAVVNLLWSFAVLHHVDEALLTDVLKRLAEEDISTLGARVSMQLHQAQVMLEDLYGGVIDAPQVLTEKQLKVARSTWQRISQASAHPSRLQADVVAALTRLGCKPRNEGLTSDGLFSIDTTVEWEGRRVAVEVDGPSHFTCSRPFRPLGRTLAKRRCLEFRGWSVLSVPGHEWRALDGDPRAEERYLRVALDGALWRTHVLDGLSMGGLSADGLQGRSPGGVE